MGVDQNGVVAAQATALVRAPRACAGSFVNTVDLWRAVLYQRRRFNAARLTPRQP
jgi:hypothetical protein